MDESLCSILIGILAGAVGYWFTTFSMQPILRFRNFRDQILMDFIYYAQVINAKDLNEKMQTLFQQRVLANSRASAQMFAAIQDLPRWYLAYLKYKGLRPEEAARHLIGYSNTTDYNDAHKLEDAIRRHLGLPEET